MATLLVSVAAFAQFEAQELTKWESRVEADKEADTYNVIFTGAIAEGYHTYTLTDEFSPTEFTDIKTVDCELVGKPFEISTPTTEVDMYGDTVQHYYGKIEIAQKVKVTGQNPSFKGWRFYMGNRF